MPNKPPTVRRKPRHLESIEQRLFIKRVRLDPRTKDLPIFAIPNGGKRGKREAAIMKAEGVLAGVPDIFCAVLRETPQSVEYRSWPMSIAEAVQAIPDTRVVEAAGMFLEFKTEKGRLSHTQDAVTRSLRNNGYKVCLVRSAEEAWDVLSDYIGIEVPNG